jgi:HD-GYP domain-containing protein (c-di-GMP phosphodiesterase class II)
LHLSPADPLQEQLQALQLKVRAVVPQVQRLTPIYDSRPLPPEASGRGGSSVVLPVSQDGRLDFVVGFHAPEAAAFSEAEQATLEALAELIGLTVRNHFNALASLYVAAEVAHDFAALRDFETGDHLNRVSHYSRLIAEGLAERRGLSAHAVDQIARFSLLHDIGKIGIPDRILLKQGPLTDEERQVMNTHVQLGLEMIGKVLGQYDLSSLPGARVLCNVIRHHHERLDGSGYPEGLKGEAISLEGRIVAVADVFDAVVSRRPYSNSAKIQEGLAVVQQEADAGRLDGDCVAELKQVLAAKGISW